MSYTLSTPVPIGGCQSGDRSPFLPQAHLSSVLSVRLLGLPSLFITHRHRLSHSAVPLGIHFETPSIARRSNSNGDNDAYPWYLPGELRICGRDVPNADGGWGLGLLESRRYWSGRSGSGIGCDLYGRRGDPASVALYAPEVQGMPYTQVQKTEDSKKCVICPGPTPTPGCNS